MKKNTLHPCPCCGAKVIVEPGNYEICKNCGWEDDPVQREDPNFKGGANAASLNEARAAWAEKKH
jgi:anaerobic ribonucleoside-triphosphate reductase